jgi:hypothetical protein
MCRGQWCNGRHCRLKPRCRWAIIGPDGVRLEPHRIKVMLVETVRANGKVKQEIIAMLGTIEAAWLESFWADAPDPELRTEKWEFCSLRCRTAFWQDVLTRMGAIGDNRLSKDDRIVIRRAIHKVVPWVMEPERKRLEIFEAQKVYQQLHGWHASIERDVARDQEMIDRYTAELQKDRAESAKAAKKVLLAGLHIAELTKPS